MGNGCKHGSSDLSEDERRIVEDFHRLAFRRFSEGRGAFHCQWLDVPAVKYPTDLWMYQELVCRRRPGLIIETGSHRGGSGLFLASICDLVGHGRVVSIDIGNDDGRPLPAHPRLRFIAGNSVDPQVVAQVHALAAGDDEKVPEVLVILDSDHRLPHVLKELEAYAPLVRPGGYLIVEDTHVNGRPNWPEYGPGPAEAVAFFLARHPEFQADRECERFLMSLNAGGYLRRLDTAATEGGGV